MGDQQFLLTSIAFRNSTLPIAKPVTATNITLSFAHVLKFYLSSVSFELEA